MFKSTSKIKSIISYVKMFHSILDRVGVSCFAGLDTQMPTIHLSVMSTLITCDERLEIRCLFRVHMTISQLAAKDRRIPCLTTNTDVKLHLIHLLNIITRLIDRSLLYKEKSTALELEVYSWKG